MDSDASPTPIFHLFPYLPPEIRLQVWSLALSGPRTEYATCCIYVAFDRDVLRLTEDVLNYLGQEEWARVESMIVEVADTGPFGLRYLTTLQRMPRLRTLVLVLTDLPIIHTRLESTRQYLHVLRVFFWNALKSNPEWACPHMTLLGRDGKEVLGVITGRRGDDR